MKNPICNYQEGCAVLPCYIFIFLISLSTNICAGYDKQRLYKESFVVNQTSLRFQLQAFNGFTWSNIKNFFIEPMSTKDFSGLPFDLEKIRLRLYETLQGTYFEFVPGGQFITRPLGDAFKQKHAPLKITGPNTEKYFGAIVRNRYHKNIKLGHTDKHGKWVMSVVRPDKNCAICWTSLFNYKNIVAGQRKLCGDIVSGDWTVFEFENEARVVKTDFFEKHFLTETLLSRLEQNREGHPLKEIFKWKTITDCKK